MDFYTNDNIEKLKEIINFLYVLFNLITSNFTIVKEINKILMFLMYLTF